MLPPTMDVTRSMNFEPQPASGGNVSIPQFNSESVTNIQSQLLDVSINKTNEWGMRNNQVDRISVCVCVCVCACVRLACECR